MDTFSHQFEKYLRYLASSSLTANTRKQYACQTRLFLRWLSGRQYSLSARSDAVEALLNYDRYMREEQALKPSTINFTYSALGDFFHFLGFSNLQLARHPRSLGKVGVLSLEEQYSFVRVVTSEMEARDRAIVLLMLLGGLRIGEVSLLNCNDVHLDTRPRYLEIRLKRSRTVPISSLLFAILRDWIQSESRRTSTNPALFFNRNDTRLSVPSLDQIVRKCGRAARLNLSAQVLRNTCIGNLLRKLDTVSVSQITGADLEVLRRFKDVSEKDVLQRVEQLHDRANETVTRLPGTAFAPSLSGSQVDVLSQVTQF